MKLFSFSQWLFKFRSYINKELIKMANNLKRIQNAYLLNMNRNKAYLFIEQDYELSMLIHWTRLGIKHAYSLTGLGLKHAYLLNKTMNKSCLFIEQDYE